MISLSACSSDGSDARSATPATGGVDAGGSLGTGASTAAGASPGSGASPGAGASTAAGGTPGTGASPGAGGSADGGQAGSAGGASATGIGCAGADIVCDDFESDLAGTMPASAHWDMTPYEHQMSIAPLVDSSIAAASGSNVFSVSGQVNSGLGAFVVPSSGLPTVDNRFYVRVFIQFDKATSDLGPGHMGFLVASESRQNDGAELRLGLSGKISDDTLSASQRTMLELNLIGGGTGEVSRYSSGWTSGGPGPNQGPGFQFDAATWYCLEALFDGGASEFRLWIDDVELETMHVTDFRGTGATTPVTDWGFSMNYVKIGAQNYDLDAGVIHYDDVAIATQRIGCN